MVHKFADAMIWEGLTQKAKWIHQLLVNNPQGSFAQDDLCQEPAGSSFYCQWEWRDDTHKNQHLSLSLAGTPMPLPEIKTNGRTKLKIPEPGGGEMMVVVFSTILPRGELILSVGQSRSLQQDQLRQWRILNLILTSLIFFIFAGLSFWYINQVSERFHRLNREVTKLRSSDRKRWFLESPTETRPLVQIIDRLLVAEERHLQRIRRTLSHLSHTLRIPVTSLVHLVEAPELQNHPGIKTILTEQTTLLKRLIERHLRRASLVGRFAQGEIFRLGQELPAMVRTLDILHYDKGLEIATQIPEDLDCPGNRDDILELIGNLSDNACKWAASKVIISAGSEDGFWLTIEDDGPGVEESQLDSLRQWTGKRMDESQNNDGMGLIIARDIVEIYGGEIILGRSPELGGFMVRILFGDTDKKN
ncbi:MAG: sensor histidine kinase [Magnetococcales bacterium]|nr:sensor histidine kinase [Magnetococcales bacterium]